MSLADRIKALRQACTNCHGEGLYFVDSNHVAPCAPCIEIDAIAAAVEEQRVRLVGHNNELLERARTAEAALEVERQRTKRLDDVNRYVQDERIGMVGDWCTDSLIADHKRLRAQIAQSERESNDAHDLLVKGVEAVSVLQAVRLAQRAINKVSDAAYKVGDWSDTRLGWALEEAETAREALDAHFGRAE